MIGWSHRNDPGARVPWWGRWMTSWMELKKEDMLRCWLVRWLLWLRECIYGLKQPRYAICSVFFKETKLLARNNIHERSGLGGNLMMCQHFPLFLVAGTWLRNNNSTVCLKYWREDERVGDYLCAPFFTFLWPILHRIVFSYISYSNQAQIGTFEGTKKWISLLSREFRIDNCTIRKNMHKG